MNAHVALQEAWRVKRLVPNLEGLREPISPEFVTDLGANAVESGDGNGGDCLIKREHQRAVAARCLARRQDGRKSLLCVLPER